MTKEEAIEVLNMVDAYGVADEAKRMAIEALQAEPTEIETAKLQNAYNEGFEACRKAVLDEIYKVCFSRNREWIEFRLNNGSNGERDYIINFVKHLPPVMPTQRTGKWISRQQFFPMSGRVKSWVECSECYAEKPYKTKYCPDCGSYNGGEYAD